MISRMYTCFYKTRPQGYGRFRNGRELTFVDFLALIGLQSIDIIQCALILFNACRNIQLYCIY